jgi:hypothetical protein
VERSLAGTPFGILSVWNGVALKYVLSVKCCRHPLDQAVVHWPVRVHMPSTHRIKQFNDFLSSIEWRNERQRRLAQLVAVPFRSNRCEHEILCIVLRFAAEAGRTPKFHSYLFYDAN